MINHLKLLPFLFFCFFITLLSACGGGGGDESGGGDVNSLCDQPYPDIATSLYILPYEVGAAYQVSQGNCDSPTHNADFAKEFAYDFAMNIGTEIYASRGGTVVAIREDVANGTFGFDNINFVRIDHGDATSGGYRHISQNGALVNVGDSVLQGQLIALSGNTGTLGLSILHFEVTENFRNANNRFQTLPVSFLNASPMETNGLREGVTYMALSY